MSDDKPSGHPALRIINAGDLPREVVEMILDLIKDQDENRKVMRMLTGALIVALTRTGPIKAPITDEAISKLDNRLDYWLDIRGNTATWVARPDPRIVGEKATKDRARDPYCVVTDELIERAAIMATYELDTLGLNSPPMKFQRFVYPSSGMFLMAKAHWDGQKDSRKATQLSYARSYLMEAVTLGAWEDDEGKGKA